MQILALDASTDVCAVALGDGAHWAERVENAGQRHSELLLPMVQALLAEARLDLAALDGIAFGAGPGSFTGLRIACGVAQGLALGADLPVVGVATLQAMAEAARQKSGRTRVIAALDARMREVYVAAYEHDGLRWRVVLEPAVAMPGEAPLPPGNGWTGVGNGFAAYPMLRERFGGALAGCDAGRCGRRRDRRVRRAPVRARRGAAFESHRRTRSAAARHRASAARAVPRRRGCARRRAMLPRSPGVEHSGDRALCAGRLRAGGAPHRLLPVGQRSVA